MDDNNYLTNFVRECSAIRPETSDEKFIGWEGLVSVLVYEGIKIILPELKEWVKMGATLITAKRLELRQKLVAYAKEKELDFPQAERAAGVITDRITEDNVGTIINAFSN